MAGPEPASARDSKDGEHASRLREEHSWEYLVYLTDLPLVHAGEALLCEVSAEDQAVAGALGSNFNSEDTEGVPSSQWSR